MAPVSTETLERLLKRERAARKEAEKLLEAKSLELYDANTRLQALADSLDQRVQERTAELEQERNNALSTAAALRASEKRFNDIAEIVGEYFWEMDPGFHFLNLTAQAASVFGYSRDELIGRSLFDFIDAAEGERLRGILQEHFENGRPFRNIRVKSRHREGQTVWQRIGGAPLFSDSGALLRYRGAGLDVTSEERSKSNLEVLAMALEHASEGFAITDAEGIFNYLNPAHVTIYGYTDESELLGQHWSILYRPEEVQRLTPDIQNDIAATGGFSGEAEGLRKDGSVFPEIFSLQALPDGGLLCVCRDDTERRRVLTDLQTQNSLRSALLDNIRTGILFEDSQAGAILTNPNICHFFSLDPEDETLRGLDCLGFFTRAKHRIQHGGAFFQRIGELIQKRQRETNLEWSMHDGRVLSFDYFPVTVGADFRGHLWAFRDITQERAQQAILEEARASAEAGATAKSVFLANMSHEIRTPLNGIIGMNRFLMREPLNETQKEYAQSVDSSAVSLLRIIDDILDFSKIEAGRLEIDEVDFSLPDLLDAVVDVLQMRALGKDIAFHLICPPDVPRQIRGDPSRLRQILLNLAGNAIKFTEAGHVCVRVGSVATDNGGTTLVFSIEDTGIGMDEATMERIFQPFSQGDSSVSRRFGGTGLGLAISHNLTTLMGGRIDARSTFGEGSVFEVTLPFATAQGPGRSPPAFAGLPLRALVSGGDALQQEAITALLEGEGLHMQCTESLPQGRTRAEAWAEDESLLWILLPRPEESPLAGGASLEPDRLPPSVHPVWITRQPVGGTAPPFPTVPIIQQPIARTKLVRKLLEIAGFERPGDSRQTDASHPLARLDLKGLRVLLAEDNRINQEVCRIMLETLGAVVDVVDDGRGALQQVTQHAYDLILMDIRMPVMDGIETCIRLRAHGLNTPIVALTADAMKGDRERFLSAGMNAYLSKPLMEEDLAEVLADLFPDRCAARRKPVAKGASAAPKILDTAALIRVLGGDATVARTLLDDFLVQTETLLESAAAHLEAGEKSAASSVFHRLSGSAFSIQAQELAQHALDLETRVEDGLAPDIDAAFETLKAAYERLKDLLENTAWPPS